MKPVSSPFGDPRVWLRVTLLVACALAALTTSADPDLWGHVRFGGDIVAARAVPRVDPYSFTSDRKWVNHEWLSEVAMYGAWRSGGATGLIALKLVLLALVLAVVGGSLGASRVTPVARDGLLLLTVIGLLPRVSTLRPQVFSLVAFASLLALTSAVDRGHRRALLAIPAVFLAWVNLHGGWLVGGGILAFWIVARVATAASWRHRLQLIATGAAAAAATLVNPYGAGMWRFLGDTVGLGRADIMDWAPMRLMPAPIVTVWAAACLVAIGLAVLAGRRNDPVRLGIVLLLGVASFRVNRLDAFFVLSTVLLLGSQLRGLSQAPERQRRVRTAARPAFALASAALIVVPGSLAIQPDVGCIKTQDIMPERDAAAFVVGNHLEGRMLTWFTYGEYAIWFADPALRVSLDGRRETVYTNQVLADHYSFFRGERRAASYPTGLRADYVWVPNDLRAATMLDREGWRRIFRGPRSSIFGRPDDARVYWQPPRSQPAACFPGL